MPGSGRRNLFSAGVKHMREVANVDTRATPDGSVVVFIRASGLGSAAQSSVFDVTDSGPPVLIGILAAKKKMAYRTMPGRHMFMIVGENADFLDSNLAPGKVYHVVTAMGAGAFKERNTSRNGSGARPSTGTRSRPKTGSETPSAMSESFGRYIVTGTERLGDT